MVCRISYWTLCTVRARGLGVKTRSRSGVKAKEKGRARSCDRVRDPPGPCLPHGNPCLPTSKEVYNKYKYLILESEMSEYRTQS
jgi:hypothetical protein